MDPALRQYILLRDDGCAARFANSPFWATRWPMLQGLPAAGRCANEFGGDVNPNSLMGLTIDHVKTELMMGKRAPDDIWHLWALCWGHHIWSNWATNTDVREAARHYIHAANMAASVRGWPVPPETANA